MYEIVVEGEDGEKTEWSTDAVNVAVLHERECLTECILPFPCVFYVCFLCVFDRNIGSLWGKLLRGQTVLQWCYYLQLC